MRFSTMTICSLVLGLGGGAIAQTGTLDQESPFSNAGYNLSSSTLTWQQQVRVGIAGQLEGFELTIQGDQGAQFNARVRIGDGWNTGTPAFEGLFTKPGSGNEIMFIDVTSANIMLDVGETFVIETQGNDTGAGLVGSKTAPPSYPEELYLNGPGCFADCEWRHGFNTYMLTGPPALTIDVSGDCPGTVTVEWDNATPSQPAGLIFARNQGSFTIPTGPCQGTQLGLGSQNIQLVRQFNTGPNGSGTMSGNAGSSACGGFLQVVVADGSPCDTSNVEQIPQ